MTSLAVEGGVSASTQGKALAALLFLWQQVLAIVLPWLDEVVRAKRPQRVPTLKSADEVVQALHCLDGVHALMANLLCGTGMRLMEATKIKHCACLIFVQPIQGWPYQAGSTLC